MRVFSACFIILFVVFFVFNLHTVFAQEFFNPTQGQVNEALIKTTSVRVLPGNPLFLLISIKEKFTRFFQPSSLAKAQYDLVLSGKRLKEVQMLMEKGNVKAASKSLENYTKRINSMILQIAKAKSQNQDITSLSEKIAVDLAYHEVLFGSINQKRVKSTEDKQFFKFSATFDAALGAFFNAIEEINYVKPGLKGRFRIINKQNSGPVENVPVDNDERKYEASHSASPARKIIY